MPAIIPLDGRPHAPAAVQQWLGDSRGHWEGDTLVIDTTNYKPRAFMSVSSDKLHVTERFSRSGPETLKYEITIDDPEVWTKPWSLMIPLRQSPNPVFEYACHEGNEGLRRYPGGSPGRGGFGSQVACRLLSKPAQSALRRRDADRARIPQARQLLRTAARPPGTSPVSLRSTGRRSRAPQARQQSRHNRRRCRTSRAPAAPLSRSPGEDQHAAQQKRDVEVRFSRQVRTGERQLLRAAQAEFGDGNPSNASTTRCFAAACQGQIENSSAADPKQTGTTESVYNARRRAIMHPGPAGIGVMRKIQFARMSIGKEKTTRIPTTQSIMITIVEQQTAECTRASQRLGGFIRLLEEKWPQRIRCPDRKPAGGDAGGCAAGSGY